MSLFTFKEENMIHWALNLRFCSLRWARYDSGYIPPGWNASSHHKLSLGFF